MQQLPDAVLREVVGKAADGVVVCDARQPDHPVVYVNPAFERMTGYSAAELLGRNLRLLQGTEREQEGRKRLREALARGEHCRALLRNQRKDGSAWWNEIELRPVHGEGGELTHFISFHRDAGERARAPERPLEGLPSWMREDRLTGLASRAWFEELLLREWAGARRDGKQLAVMLFDIDGLHTYNETFGRAAGDSCIRQVARIIASSYRRGVDLAGRWENGCLAVLVNHGELGAIADYAAVVAQRVADLRIHHPRAATQKFITVSTGIAACTPGVGGWDVRALLQAAENALREAKREGRGQLKATSLDPAPTPQEPETTAITPNAG